MKSIRVLLVMIGVLVSLQREAAPQNLSGNRKNVVVRPSDSRPEFRANLSEYAKPKVFLPRSSYRFGELVKADVGLRLTNTSQYYFTRAFDYRIIINDSKGSPVTIKSIANVDARLNYEKVANTLLTHSTYLIIGCNTPMLHDFAKSIEIAELDDPEWLFKNNLFGPPADACIDLAAPALLEINVEVSNNSVVIPKTGDDTKTLVGSVRGTSLRILVER